MSVEGIRGLPRAVAENGTKQRGLENQGRNFNARQNLPVVDQSIRGGRAKAAQILSTTQGFSSLVETGQEAVFVHRAEMQAGVTVYGKNQGVYSAVAQGENPFPVGSGLDVQG